MATNNTLAVSTVQPNSKGGIYIAPFGSTAPTDGTSPLDKAFVCIGYITDDGVEFGNDSDEGDATNAWGGDEVAHGAGKKKLNFQCSILQTSDPDALKMAYHDDDISGTLNNVTINDTGRDPLDKVIVIEAVRGNNTVVRRLIPHAVFSKKDSEKWDNDKPSSIQVTYSKSAVNGSLEKTWITTTA